MQGSSWEMTKARMKWWSKDEYDVEKKRRKEYDEKKGMTLQRERDREVSLGKNEGSVSSRPTWPSPTLEMDTRTSNSNIHKEWMGKLECPGEKPISQASFLFSRQFLFFFVSTSYWSLLRHFVLVISQLDPCEEGSCNESPRVTMSRQLILYNNHLVFYMCLSIRTSLCQRQNCWKFAYCFV